MKKPVNVDGNPNYITWIARAERWKKPERFLDLAESFPDESFLMIMPDAGDNAFRNRIKRRATSVEHITFLDYVPPDQIDRYFRKSRIFVNTSNSEGFPNTYVQAARAATPILSYTVNPDGILDTYDMGICAEQSFSKLKDGLRFLLKEEKSRSKMGQNARRYALEHHNLEQVIEDDKQILRNLTTGT